MDLTLFILIVILIIVIFYFANILGNLRKDIRNLNLCSNMDKKENFIIENDNKVFIDKLTNGLSYLKNFL